jgi:hypothetical protein
MEEIMKKFDISYGVLKNTYKTKIDGHIVEIEICNNAKIDYVGIWWSYDNNWRSYEFYYSKEQDIFLYAKITERQAKILREIMQEVLAMQEMAYSVKI